MISFQSRFVMITKKPPEQSGGFSLHRQPDPDQPDAGSRHETAAGNI